MWNFHYKIGANRIIHRNVSFIYNYTVFGFPVECNFVGP